MTPLDRIGLAVVIALAALTPASGQAARAMRAPTVDDLMTLKTAGSALISPDGRFVAYTVTETDFEQDAFVTQLWIAPTAGGTPYQLTRGPKSVGVTRWSPDGRWLAFTCAARATRARSSRFVRMAGRPRR